MSVAADTFLARYARRDDGDAVTVGDLRFLVAQLAAENRSIRTELANAVLQKSKPKYSSQATLPPEYNKG